jgi:hypothetical protein
MTFAQGLAGVRAWFEGMLVREGAVLEPEAGGGVFACLPAALQQRLALPDAALLRVAAAPGPGEVGVPLEGAAVQACLDLAGGRGAMAGARLEAPACRSEKAHAIAASVLQVDNAAVHAGEVRVQPLRWLVLEFAWTAAADERDSGSVFVAHEPTLGVSSAAIAAALVAQLAAATPAEGVLPGREDVAAAVGRAWPVARREIDAAVAPFAASAASRLRREQTRLSAYHDKLSAEAKRRRRGRGGGETVAGKLEAIARDRDEKQRELVARFAARCEVVVPSVLGVEYEGVVAGFVVRRRTRERVVWVGVDPWGRVGVEPNCEACGAQSRLFSACDDAVHLVCMACKGKRCVVCAGAGGG